MKKLIVLATIAIAAMMSHGASVYWTCTNVYSGNSSDLNGGIAYFMTTDMLSVSAANALSGKSAAEITTALGSAYSYKPTTAGTYTTTGVANATLGLEDSSSYTAYLIIFNGETVADSTSFYVTGTKALETFSGTETASVKFGTQKTGSQSAWGGSVGGGGGDSGVPEPTSGLLLLVGGAMLALRRKQK